MSGGKASKSMPCSPIKTVGFKFFFIFFIYIFILTKNHSNKKEFDKYS